MWRYVVFHSLINISLNAKIHLLQKFPIFPFVSFPISCHSMPSLFATFPKDGKHLQLGGIFIILIFITLFFDPIFHNLIYCWPTSFSQFKFVFLIKKLIDFHNASFFSYEAYGPKKKYHAEDVPNNFCRHKT